MGNETFEDDEAGLEAGEIEQEKEAPSGDLPPSPPAPIAPIDQVVDAAGEDAVALLKIASKYGIDNNDPMWSAVLVLLGSREAAKQTVEAAAKIESAGKDLGERIFDQTMRAGANLKSTISDASTASAKVVVENLTTGIVKAINKPFNDGVKKIETVIGAVDEHVEKEREVILATWRKDLASAAAREARRRSLIIAATSWGTILTTCAVCIVIGAGGTFGILDIMHKIVPWGLHLILQPNGNAACGVFHDALVCGVTH